MSDKKELENKKSVETKEEIIRLFKKTAKKLFEKYADKESENDSSK